MVDEAEVRRLHGVLRESLGPAAAREIAHAAGVRTADYLLARRIPKPVQALLKVLPAPLAARVLLTAIGRNSWTFAGSGQFSYVFGRPCVLTIRDNPLSAAGRPKSPPATSIRAPSSASSRCWCTATRRCAKSPARPAATPPAGSRSPGRRSASARCRKARQRVTGHGLESAIPLIGDARPSA
uniref:4-vinyl protochlorophyllide reductase n=1 Tax=Rubrivivax gelatinosus TaxID=28068 RepID=Q7X2C6_RUBGE|nr:4-vinyl protochlorophyllide reductase [Rubrivivax gelatinosus]